MVGTRPRCTQGVNAYGPGRRMTPSWRRGRVAAGHVVFLPADPIVEAGSSPSQFVGFLLKALGIAWVW